MNNDEKERLKSVLVTLTIAMPSGEQVRQALFEQIESLFDEPEERPVMGPQMNCGPIKIPPKEMTAKELVKRIENWCKADHESSFNPNSSAWRLFDYIKKEAGL